MATPPPPPPRPPWPFWLTHDCCWSCCFYFQLLPGGLLTDVGPNPDVGPLSQPFQSCRHRLCSESNLWSTREQTRCLLFLVSRDYDVMFSRAPGNKSWKFILQKQMNSIFLLWTSFYSAFHIKSITLDVLYVLLLLNKFFMHLTSFVKTKGQTEMIGQKVKMIQMLFILSFYS